MKNLKLNKELILTAARMYANGRNLEKDPRLYIDHVASILRNGCGIDFTDEEFYYNFKKSINPHSEFIIDNSDLRNDRPIIFYKKGFKPRDRKEAIQA